jgi:uracil-DNA glycosylase
MPTPKNQLKQHCLAIAKCKVARAVLTTPMRALDDDQLRCTAIISAQLASAMEPGAKQPATLPWLVPEPWNGNLAEAPILFIGQNPSANHEEEYPVDDGEGVNFADDELFAFFNERFEPSTPGCITDGSRVPLTDGQPGRSNQFLTRVKKVAKQILNREPQPGIDYAITEAVRCKAAKATGVERALSTCAKFYLAETLRLSGAKVVICLGTKAREAFYVAIEKDWDGKCHRYEWNGRKVVFLAHSNARGNAKAAGLSETRRLMLRRHILQAR